MPNKLTSRNEKHPHNTMRKNDFHTARAKKDFSKNKFSNKSLTDYNEIKTGRKLKTSQENEKLFYVKDSINTFKKKLRNYLLQQRI